MPEDEVERTPDGRHIVVNGRRWRASDPSIPEPLRAELVRALMDARRRVRTEGDAARPAVNDAKIALGERGDPWWEPTPEGTRTRIAATIRTVLRARDGRSMCPSEAARVVGGENWRELMGTVREVAGTLVDDGEVVLTRKGEPVSGPDVRGPIRIAPVPAGVRPAEVDVLVVGGGPAGLSAATWLGRYRRSTLIVDAGRQRNLAAREIHGMLGTGPRTPEEFYVDVDTGLGEYPTVRRLHGEVTELHREAEDRFVARVAPLEATDPADPAAPADTSDAAETTTVVARRVVLATGVRDRLPEVAGIDEHYGIDVHHCPACDGLTAAGKRVIVLGVGAHVPAYASELLDWASEVVIITESDSDPTFDEAQRAACAEHHIEVVDGVARELVGDPGALRGVRLDDGGLVEGSAVFFSYAHHPSTELAEALGCELDDEGGIVVNRLQLTSVDGVYAAGDIVTGLQLVPIAVGTGAAAGVACATSLRGHATAESVPDPAPPTRTFTRPAG